LGLVIHIGQVDIRPFRDGTLGNRYKERLRRRCWRFNVEEIYSYLYEVDCWLIVVVARRSVTRKGLWYKTKSTGRSWSAAKLFYHENNRNSYPALVEDRSGQLLAVWDSSHDPDKKRTASPV
jgi:hypothetical protein